MVVGDDDQSIYGWRGADIRNILDFEKAFPSARTVRLERNYRSTQRILDAANLVIAENVNRKGKTLRTERVGGEPISLVEAFDENDEARWIVGEVESRIRDTPTLSYDSIAVLYRTNAQARALEDAFRREGVPYQVIGSVRFYERREIQDVLAYLRIVSNPRDEGAFARVVSYPRRGVGLASQEHLARWAADQGISLLEAAARADEAPEIRAAGAKGLMRFADLIQRFSIRATQARVGDLLEELVEDLDLMRHLYDEGPEGEDRARNVAELIAGAVDFDATLIESVDADDVDTFTELDLFLQQVALVADVDRLDPDADTVTLMTLHNAKGLEFPLVFIAGMEEGLFPLARARDEPDKLEEERRLFYVGITRAEDKLCLCWARQRRRAGDFSYNSLSTFVESVPDELLERRATERLRLLADSTPHRRRPRAHESWGSGAGYGSRSGFASEYEPDADQGLNQDLPRFVKGERVTHETFGSGSVVEISGFGRDLKVTVDFDEAGRKKLLLRYASLEKDWP
jgi:DNA helicase-2/ATP-dependent DNA helicase PcrA